MNVIFHVASAVGIVAAVSNTNKIETAKQSILPAISAFVVGVFIHGMLDLCLISILCLLLLIVCLVCSL